MKWYSVDRIEEDYVILIGENMESIEVEAAKIEKGVKETEVVVQNKEGNYVKSQEKTKERKMKIAELEKNLKNRE